MADPSPAQPSMLEHLANAIRQIVQRRAGGQSSPSVFDAKTAIDERKRKLQEALENRE